VPDIPDDHQFMDPVLAEEELIIKVEALHLPDFG
jgi:hypothetical protein